MVSFGVDVSKDWVDIARTDNSRQCKRLARVDNQTQALEGYFKLQQAKYPGSSVTVESTGMYHLKVVRTCLQLGLTIRIINPVITKQLARSSVRQLKTDKADALRIALAGLNKAGYAATAEQLLPAKFYIRAGRRLAMTARRLAASKQHYGMAGLSAKTLDDTFDACCGQLVLAGQRLQMEGSMACDPRVLLLLQSLPGFGPVISAQVASEIGNISRFKHAKQLVAYAGLDPSIRQSGSSLNKTGRLTKRGSPFLRHALFLAAASARRHDPQLREVYERKRRQGKSYRQAVVHIARLLTYRLFAVWQRGTPYRKA